MSASGEVNFYLNVFTLQFAEGDEEGNLKVKLSVGEQSQEFSAERLDGGQRLRLSEEAKEFLIEALLSETSVEVSVGRYRTTLIPNNFALLYSEL